MLVEDQKGSYGYNTFHGRKFSAFRDGVASSSTLGPKIYKKYEVSLKRTDTRK